jgi:hypothetical protein
LLLLQGNGLICNVENETVVGLKVATRLNGEITTAAQLTSKFVCGQSRLFLLKRSLRFSAKKMFYFPIARMIKTYFVVNIPSENKLDRSSMAQVQ